MSQLVRWTLGVHLPIRRLYVLKYLNTMTEKYTKSTEAKQKLCRSLWLQVVYVSNFRTVGNDDETCLQVIVHVDLDDFSSSLNDFGCTVSSKGA